MTKTCFAALAFMLVMLAGMVPGGAAEVQDNRERQAMPAPSDQAPQRDDGASSGSSLSNTLSRDKGVVTPPPTGDRGVLRPPAAGPGSTPIISPPGTQGGDEVQPK